MNFRLFCMQMWKKYIPNAKVSYLEYDAPCATKHKTEIEATAGGTLYIGTPPSLSPLQWLNIEANLIAATC